MGLTPHQPDDDEPAHTNDAATGDVQPDGREPGVRTGPVPLAVIREAMWGNAAGVELDGEAVCFACVTDRDIAWMQPRARGQLCCGFWNSSAVTACPDCGDELGGGRSLRPVGYDDADTPCSRCGLEVGTAAPPRHDEVAEFRRDVIDAAVTAVADDLGLSDEERAGLTGDRDGS